MRAGLTPAVAVEGGGGGEKEKTFLWSSLHYILKLKRYRGALPSGIKRPVRETVHSPPASAEVKDAWSYTSISHTYSWNGT
jgi:hypothetical protein